MGSINYGSNDYINLGLNLNLDIYQDFDTVQLLAKDIENIIKDNDFYYFSINIKPGYYEGFYINIEYKDYIFCDYKEKKEAQKEVTKIKQILYLFSDMDIVKYNPGWCIGYSSEKETKKAIKNAIKEMRQDIKNSLTEYTFYIQK